MILSKTCPLCQNNDIVHHDKSGAKPACSNILIVDNHKLSFSLIKKYCPLFISKFMENHVFKTVPENDTTQEKFMDEISSINGEWFSFQGKISVIIIWKFGIGRIVIGGIIPVPFSPVEIFPVQFVPVKLVHVDMLHVKIIVHVKFKKDPGFHANPGNIFCPEYWNEPVVIIMSQNLIFCKEDFFAFSVLIYVDEA